jgi:FHA domain
MFETRVFSVRDAPTGNNQETRFVSVDRPGDAPAAEVAFLTHYREIAAALATVSGPALALFVVDHDGLAATAILRPSPERFQSATLGRHTQAEIHLAADPGLALRHLAILLHPYSGSGPLKWRVMDLRTGASLRDERGEHTQAFEADGSAFFSVRRYTVLAFVCAPGARPLPPDPREAWRSLPPRRTFPAAGGDARRGRRLSILRRKDPGSTGVQFLPGVAYAGRTGVHGQPIGVLRIRSGGDSARFVVDRASAEAGILLGRSERCDDAGVPVLTHPNISRVHLLIVMIEDQLLAVDLGSTNGTWLADRPVRHHLLRNDDELELGVGLARARWEAHGPPLNLEARGRRPRGG